MDKIDQIFTSRFERWGISLPADAQSSRSRGTISKSGWHISYLFGEDAKGQFLDYYASHRMTNARHERIYETGATESLPAMEEMRVCSDDPREDAKLEAEYFRRNREVERLLKRKGL